MKILISASCYFSGMVRPVKLFFFFLARHAGEAPHLVQGSESVNECVAEWDFVPVSDTRPKAFKAPVTQERIRTPDLTEQTLRPDASVSAVCVFRSWMKVSRLS